MRGPHSFSWPMPVRFASEKLVVIPYISVLLAMALDQMYAGVLVISQWLSSFFYRDCIDSKLRTNHYLKQRNLKL